MADELPTQSKLTTRIVYLDLPGMIEVETRVVVGDWRGVARVYASPSSLEESARSLEMWSRQPKGRAELEAGADNGIGWMRLQFYPVDLAGHLVCHVQLTKRSRTLAPSEELHRLSLEFRTEPALVERYARRLEAITHTLGEDAVLLGVIE